MLDKIVEQQLGSLEVAKVSIYIKEKNRYLFRRVGSDLLVGKSYMLRLDSKLTDREASGMVASNWNQGRVPSHTLMKAGVRDKKGTMYLLHGEYIDEEHNPIGEEPWDGWLPLGQLEILEELK